ncbi:MAG TPA: hypothetical protein VGK78_10480 [Nocardioides sp.]|uniref:hypothetical protein n=1 Tax=Nocardioides sp. TaxID=35761 RepID=UPI002F41A8BA
MTSRLRTALRLLAVSLGAAMLVPLLGVDPAILTVLLDTDFLALAAMVGLIMLGVDLRVAAHRVERSLPVLWVRVGAELTRRDPGTLVRV